MYELSINSTVKRPSALIEACTLGCVLAALALEVSARAAEAVPAGSLKEVPLAQIRLLESPFKQRQEVHRRLLLEYDLDRLLHNFRVNAGLPSNARPYGGWEAPAVGLRGHFVGHYLSASSLMYGATGDAQFKDRSDKLVAELGKCQAQLGGGYLSAFPASEFDVLETKFFDGVWAPYYTIHKILAGLVDAHEQTGNRQALEIATRMADYFESRISQLTPEAIENMTRTDYKGNPVNEYGGIAESWLALYRITGQERCLKLARVFMREWFIAPLAAGQDRLERLHANTHIPQATSFAQAAALTGEERLRTAAHFFWRCVTERHSFAVGGNAFDEKFKAPGVEAADLTDLSAETCNTHNLLKLTRALFEQRPDCAYADYYEHALYNHILASIAPDTGATTYHLSVKPGHFKVYGTREDSMWCCTGSGIENTARYGQGIYFAGTDSLWVNLYIPSTVNWPDREVALTQETLFPKADKVRLRLSCKKPIHLSLHLRLPGWLAAPARVAINGKLLPPEGVPGAGRYLTLSQRWSNGDTIELSLPMSVRVRPAMDDSAVVSFFHGPVLLAGALGKQDMPASDTATSPQQFHKLPAPPVPPLLAGLADALVAATNPPMHVRVAGAGSTNTPSEIPLVPFYDLHHQRYTVYWRTQPAAPPPAEGASKSPLKVQSAQASSTLSAFNASKAVDGIISDDSRWVSLASPAPAWLALELGSTQKLAGIHLYSGYQNTSPIQDFVVQFWHDSRWHNIPSATVTGNRAAALAIPFDDTVDVTTDKLRLWITASHQGIARIAEVVVWPASAGGLPPLAGLTEKSGPAQRSDPAPLIYLNQSGFNLGKPKRFTAPTLPDGATFEVRPATGGAALFEGKLQQHIGDFTAFDPSDEREYIVVAGTNSSVPFRVGPWWLERVTYQNAVNFMVDSRHYVGNVRAVCQGSFGWRDDHHFGWELHTLVPQFLSNPSAYQRMPRQIQYEKAQDPALWGALQPYREDAPDIVKLIHWGADVIVTRGLTHELLKAQLAYFLYAWPWLKQWLPDQNYQAVRDFTFAHWSDSTCDHRYPYDESDNHDLLALKTKIGSTKGALPPGFSVEPNLLLYEAAKREGRAEAGQYFEAATRQVAWMISSLDWNDPQTTKGQRMSEWITMTGLAHLLREYPDRAPAGLHEKINAWAEVAVRRSNNLWDFRKLDDGDRWTPMGDKPTMWNEPGNVLGLPAALLAAQPFVTNSATRERLEQLVWSHFDNGFGRNPVGRHFSYDAPREIEGVELGWFSFYPGGIGRLADARFVFDGSPKDGHYPYHPERGNYGWTEGWIQFNTAFNISLAYLGWANTHLELRRDGDDLAVQLQAPLNFQYGVRETGEVWVASASGDHETLKVTEVSPNSRQLSGRIRIVPDTTAHPGDGVLQRAPGAKIETGYGYGFLGRRAALDL
jgi:DUF1680 family protein